MRHFFCNVQTLCGSKTNYKVLIITCPSKYTWTIDWRKLKIRVVRTEWNVRFFKCLTCFSICRLKRILRQLDGAYSDSFFLGSDFDQWLWEEPFPDGIDMDKAQVLRGDSGFIESSAIMWLWCEPIFRSALLPLLSQLEFSRQKCDKKSEKIILTIGSSKVPAFLLSCS